MFFYGLLHVDMPVLERVRARDEWREVVIEIHVSATWWLFLDGFGIK